VGKRERGSGGDHLPFLEEFTFQRTRGQTLIQPLYPDFFSRPPDSFRTGVIQKNLPEFVPALASNQESGSNPGKINFDGH